MLCVLRDPAALHQTSKAPLLRSKWPHEILMHIQEWNKIRSPFVLPLHQFTRKQTSSVPCVILSLSPYCLSL